MSYNQSNCQSGYTTATHSPNRGKPDSDAKQMYVVSARVETDLKHRAKETARKERIDLSVVVRQAGIGSPMRRQSSISP